MSVGPQLGLFMLLGLVFTPVVGAMAFLITYGEYSRHQPGRRRCIRLALESAVVSMVLILALVLAAALLLGRQGAAAL